jgi:hypothetical protein
MLQPISKQRFVPDIALVDYPKRCTRKRTVHTDPNPTKFALGARLLLRTKTWQLVRDILVRIRLPSAFPNYCHSQRKTPLAI